MAAQNKF